eukprot:Skav203695  [mRNA]  locus=scaffold259:265650:268708:+ [translate_table: standard]
MLRYVQSKVNPILENLVTEVLLERPENPVPFMVRWLAERSKAGKESLYSLGVGEAEKLRNEIKQLQELRDGELFSDEQQLVKKEDDPPQEEAGGGDEPAEEEEKEEKEEKDEEEEAHGATEDSVVWQLDRETFSHIVRDASAKRREAFQDFLKLG